MLFVVVGVVEMMYYACVPSSPPCVLHLASSRSDKVVLKKRRFFKHYAVVMEIRNRHGNDIIGICEKVN